MRGHELNREDYAPFSPNIKVFATKRQVHSEAMYYKPDESGW